MKISKKLVGAYACIFNSPEGRKVLEDLAEVLGAKEFSTDVADSKELWYRAGKRDTYNFIEMMITEGSK